MLKNWYKEFPKVFPILFGPENIIESKRATKESPDFFTIKTKFGNKLFSYEVDFQIIFLLSNTIRNLIYSDKTCHEYTIPQNTCQQKFFDFFFSSISKNKMHISIEYFSDFVSITQILQIDSFQQLIKKAILSILGDQDDNISTDEQKFTLLCQNINSIDVQKLKYMPDWFITKLISNAKFNNEDDRAKYLIENREHLGIKYFEQLKFDDLSKNIMNQIVLILEEIENSEMKQILMPNLINRLKSELSYMDINLLNISIYVENTPTLDFDFLYELNKQNKNYSIYYKTLYEDEIESKLKQNKDYFKSFDIIVIGGIDGFGKNSKCIKSFFNDLIRYHNEGGIILALHDVALGKLYDDFSSFYKKVIGFNDQIYKRSKHGHYKKVQFIGSSNKKEIMSYPFTINDPFDVAETHFTIALDPLYIVVQSKGENQNEGENQHYYAENLDENFADLAMCHTVPIKPELTDEKKFFYNAVCHLCKNCHNHIPSQFKNDEHK